MTAVADDNQASSDKPIQISPDAIPTDLISDVLPRAMHQPMDFRRNYERSPYGRGGYCGAENNKSADRNAPTNLIAY
jgi:hypothetical protein